MDDFCESVRQTIQQGQLVRPRDRVLIGVSGGPDSVALCSLLVRLKDELGITLSVVHVDHQLRADSTHDAVLVEELARRYRLPVTLITRHVLTEAKQRGLSLEEGARQVRYEVFLEEARRHTANRLALAHTADDQAETVLMRMIRGAGLTGLSAIPLSRPLEEVVIIRPLLFAWRRDIMAYLTRQRLAFAQDSTNTDPRFLRNRIRAELLPLLERHYNPRIKALLRQLAEQCRVDVGFLQESAQRYWKRVVSPHDGALAIRIDRFLQRPKAVQRHLIRLVIQRLQGDLTGFEFRHWRQIERLFIEEPVGSLLDLPGPVQLERQRDQVLARLPHHTSPTARHQKSHGRPAGP